MLGRPWNSLTWSLLDLYSPAELRNWAVLTAAQKCHCDRMSLHLMSLSCLLKRRAKTRCAFSSYSTTEILGLWSGIQLDVSVTRNPSPSERVPWGLLYVGDKPPPLHLDKGPLWKHSATVPIEVYLNMQLRLPTLPATSPSFMSPNLLATANVLAMIC